MFSFFPLSVLMVKSVGCLFTDSELVIVIDDAGGSDGAVVAAGALKDTISPVSSLVDVSVG